LFYICPATTDDLKFPDINSINNSSRDIANRDNVGVQRILVAMFSWRVLDMTQQADGNLMVRPPSFFTECRPAKLSERSHHQ
jgi:hypothetical protein